MDSQKPLEPLMTRKKFIETFGEDPVDMGIPTSDPENDEASPDADMLAKDDGVYHARTRY